MEIVLNYILPFFAILFGLVILHEAGHYITAKMLGVKVLEAGIGIPPRIWGFRWRDTDYTINALPMGAFVRMLGEEDPTDPESLAAQPKWKRTIIIGSGAFINLIAAIVLFAIAAMVPQTISNGGVLVGEVIDGSPAQEAGILAGDEIVEVNGRAVANSGEAIYFVRLAQGREVDFVVKRDDPRTGSELIPISNVYARWDPPTWVDECGITRSQGMTGLVLGPARVFNVSRTPEETAQLEKDLRKEYTQHQEQIAPGSPATCYSPTEFGFTPLTAAQCAALPDDERVIAERDKAELFANAPGDCYVFRPPQAVEAPTKTVSKPPWEAFPAGARKAWESLILTRNQVWSMIRGFGGGAPVTGPVGIAQATGEIIDVAGWRYLIEFAATISMGLAILNFMPIPMVDGGRLAFIALEAIRGGKRIDPQKEALVHLVGLVLMVGLFFVITYYDVARIVRGDSLLQ